MNLGFFVLKVMGLDMMAIMEGATEQDMGTITHLTAGDMMGMVMTRMKEQLPHEEGEGEVNPCFNFCFFAMLSTNSGVKCT